MSVLVVSDVHAAFEALGRVARSGGPLVILGDLVNLIDYRTVDGIVPDVVGRDTVIRLSELRQRGRHDEARTVWVEAVARLGIDVRAAIRERMIDQYRSMAVALEGSSA